ncbi:MAG TPA: putative ABC exporter domain-containing protein [Fimbriimonadales bacterium]|jgi:hypothetical protein|nr:putative ABC exporter domain-containing protein [Fimbriimonadales bacterium]
MGPLLFLTTHTVANSVKRAVQSPMRILGVLMIVGWWVMILSNSFRSPHRTLTYTPSLGVDQLTILHAAIFAGFLVLFFIRLLTGFSVPGRYIAADADVIFATPVDPKKILLHRFIFNYALALILPLFPLLLGGRAGASWLGSLFRNIPNHEAASWLGKTAVVGYLLISLFGAAISFAVGLYINRDTDESRRARKIYGTAVGALALSIAAFCVVAARSPDVLARFANLPNDPLLRACFYPVALAADFATGPVLGGWSVVLVSGSLLLAASGLLVWLALKQSPFLYDMATRGAASSQTAREWRQRRDYAMLAVLAAREGRLKPRRMLFLSRLSPPGAWAIVWRETLLSLRTNMILLLMFALIIFMMTAVFKSTGHIDPTLVLTLQIFFALSFSMSFAQAGFMDTLRKVDIQKPLPISNAAICGAEILGKAIMPIFLGVAACVVSVAMGLLTWEYLLAAIFAIPVASFAVGSMQFLAMLVFPDLQDPTQMGIRGIMQLLGVAIAIAPGLLTALAVGYFSSILPALLAGSIVEIGVCAVLVAVVSPMYSAYSTSD